MYDVIYSVIDIDSQNAKLRISVSNAADFSPHFIFSLENKLM